MIPHDRPFRCFDWCYCTPSKDVERRNHKKYNRTQRSQWSQSEDIIQNSAWNWKTVVCHQTLDVFFHIFLLIHNFNVFSLLTKYEWKTWSFWSRLQSPLWVVFQVFWTTGSGMSTLYWRSPASVCYSAHSRNFHHCIHSNLSAWLWLFGFYGDWDAWPLVRLLVFDVCYLCNLELSVFGIFCLRPLVVGDFAF